MVNLDFPENAKKKIELTKLYTMILMSGLRNKIPRWKIECVLDVQFVQIPQMNFREISAKFMNGVENMIQFEK